jgi:protein TonB
MLRVPVSFVIALLFSLVFFAILKSVIEVRQVDLSEQEDLKIIDFVRLKHEQQLTRKERVKPQKPQKEKILTKPKVNIPRPEQPRVTASQVQPLSFDLPVDLSATSALGDALVSGYGGRTISTNVIPLVRIDPLYPRGARMRKKEGYVKLEFTITEFGTVKDIEVVEAQPPGIFDDAATRALSKWKFRPKLEENKPVEQRALLKIKFKLDR